VTKEEAHDALDRAVQDYANAVFAEDGTLGMVQWVLITHVDILQTNESGYSQAVSDGLPLHDQVGLLRYAGLQTDDRVRVFGHDEE
jgi:hypothetical protein